LKSIIAEVTISAAFLSLALFESSIALWLAGITTTNGNICIPFDTRIQRASRFIVTVKSAKSEINNARERALKLQNARRVQQCLIFNVTYVTFIFNISSYMKHLFDLIIVSLFKDKQDKQKQRDLLN